jgi:hypothetical protein
MSSVTEAGISTSGRTSRSISPSKAAPFSAGMNCCIATWRTRAACGSRLVASGRERREGIRGGSWERVGRADRRKRTT